MAIIETLPTSYHIDKKLFDYWNKYSLKKVFDMNTDRFYIVDGREGVGKTTWVIQQACMLDEGLKDLNTFLSRICFTPEEFDYACKNVKNGVIIFDEAFRGFGSRSALSLTNKRLITTLMEMRQNNNIVFLVLPSFFLLDIYPAMLRSNALFNIYLDKKYQKRTWRAFSYKDKNKIYQGGLKKGWSYNVRTKMKGRFYENREHTKFPYGATFYKAYEKKKNEALKSMNLDVTYNKQGKMEKRQMVQRDNLLKIIFEEKKMSLKKLSQWLKERNVEMSQQSILDTMDKLRESSYNQSIIQQKT